MPRSCTAPSAGFGHTVRKVKPDCCSFPRQGSLLGRKKERERDSHPARETESMVERGVPKDQKKPNVAQATQALHKSHTNGPTEDTSDRRHQTRALLAGIRRCYAPVARRYSTNQEARSTPRILKQQEPRRRGITFITLPQNAPLPICEENCSRDKNVHFSLFLLKPLKRARESLQQRTTKKKTGDQATRRNGR